MSQFLTKLVIEVSKRILAFIAIPLFTFYVRWIKFGSPGMGVWLVGENRGIPTYDNGYYFYLNCCNKYPQHRIFFLCQKRPKENDVFLKDQENVIIFGSLKHYYYFALSSICFYTHEYRDVLYKTSFRAFGRNKKLVYLHHGVLGLKKFDQSYSQNCNAMDLFCIAFDHEHRILAEEAGVDDGRIIHTGYARYDNFRDEPRPEKSEICYFPTYRGWEYPLSLSYGLGFKINSLINTIINDLIINNTDLKAVPHLVNSGITIKKYLADGKLFDIIDDLLSLFGECFMHA